MKYVLIGGAGGFIGHHLVNDLKKRGYWVRGVDLKYPEFGETKADEFIIGDLKNPYLVRYIFDRCFDEVYQLAADMGGAGYIFTGENDATVMHNSATINLNMVEEAAHTKAKNLFFSSSACVYAEHNQMDPDNPNTAESSAYPAAPDSEYGWEKLFSERLYLSYQRNFGLNVHITRFHNIFGPQGTWRGGREKAPAAICRKVADASNGSEVEVWGDGKQTRSFLYIDECLEGIRRLMNSDFPGPVNIGSEEMIAINDLTKMVIDISGKQLSIRNIPGPQGVRGRKSDNTLISEKLGWAPSKPLREGMEKLYRWIECEVSKLKEAVT